MPCPQSSDLLAHGLAIDQFRGFDKSLRAILVSHAHRDHVEGLCVAWSRYHPHVKIWCTQVTRDLLACTLPSTFPLGRFQAVKVGQVFSPVPQVKVVALPAGHCDGSAMFLCEVNGKRILYTGDFRFQPSMLRERHLKHGPRLDELYFDDTFWSLPDAVPTYDQTYHMFEEAVARLFHEDDRRVIWVHASILGFEPILRRFGRTHHLKFRLSPQLAPTMRACQLRALLAQYIVPEDSTDAALVLGDRKLDMADTSARWIVPTCTAFLCTQLPPTRDHVTQLPFCTHSTRPELETFVRKLNPQRVNPCGEAVTLKCRKDHNS